MKIDSWSFIGVHRKVVQNFLDIPASTIEFVELKPKINFNFKNELQKFCFRN